MPGPSSTPPPKRIKLESASPKADNDDDFGLEPDAEVDEDHCTICLQSIADRAVIPTCSHEFCFECLMIWSQQSRRCPLCAQTIGDYLIHHIRSTYDYQKHFLPPLRTSPRPLSRTDGARIAPVHRRRERVWGPRDRAAQDEADALERAVGRRRWIYQHNLYAKHVASNKYTRYRPCPTPAQFATSQDLISRMTVFLRRELLVWPNADVEFLVTFVISLMKSIDIRSESAIKLLAEFLDMDVPYAPGERYVNAEHFAHEIYCYLRSPYRDLGVYDSLVQYDTPPGIPPPPSHERTRRWKSGPSQSHSRSPNLRPSHSREHPPSIRERDIRPEGTPLRALSREEDSGTSISLLSPTEVSRVHDSVIYSESDDDGRPAAQNYFHSPTRVNTKGKQRAPSRLLSPPSDYDILCDPPVTRQERIGSPSTLVDDVQPGEASGPAPQTPEGGNPTRSPVVLHRPPDGNTSTTYPNYTTDGPSLSLEGLHSLHNGIITSPNSKSETPEHPSINSNCPHANPARRPRYRSQRDSIIAYLRPSSTPLRHPSSIPQRRPPSLLARISDGSIMKLNTGADTDITEETGGGGHARLLSSIAERSSGPSVNDDRSEERKEATMTKAEQNEASRTSHAHLLDRVYVEKATAAEARLRTQVRLRTRLAAERRLAQDHGGKAVEEILVD